MLDGDNYIRTRLYYGTALILLELGDEVSAQVMFERAISPISNIDTLYWTELWCCNCDGEYGYLYKCRTCPYVGSVLFCEGCKVNKDEVPQCVGHNFLQIPSEGWRHLRKGTVNAEGETFDGFLNTLSRKYNDEGFQAIEPGGGGEQRVEGRRAVDDFFGIEVDS